MPYFDIVKAANVKPTYRVARVMADYDVKTEHAKERFTGEIIYPEDWHIGCIVGGSGTGKSTIAKELFPENLWVGEQWSAPSVLDDMPKSASMDDIEKIFYAVGFGSVPSWLKPFSVLSNGEKMRVELARALLEKDFVVFDEFTSVVDRQELYKSGEWVMVRLDVLENHSPKSSIDFGRKSIRNVCKTAGFKYRG